MENRKYHHGHNTHAPHESQGKNCALPSINPVWSPAPAAMAFFDGPNVTLDVTAVERDFNLLQHLPQHVTEAIRPCNGVLDRSLWQSVTRVTWVLSLHGTEANVQAEGRLGGTVTKLALPTLYNSDSGRKRYGLIMRTLNDLRNTYECATLWSCMNK